MKIVVQLILMIPILCLHAQQIKTTQDVGAWMGATLKYDLTKDLDLSLSQDIRFQESLSELDKYISEIGLSYKINKEFRIGGELRYYINQKRDETQSQNWRYNLDFKYRTKLIKHLKFRYRLRHQTAYENLFTAQPNKGESKSAIRNRVGLFYKLKNHHELYFTTEIFRTILYYRKPYFSELRFVVGDEIETKYGQFDLSFGYERELNSLYPLHFMFTRVYYTFKL